MRVSKFEGKRAVVLGLARQGKAAARYLAEHGARVVVSDLKTGDELGGALAELEGLEMEYALGGHPPELIEGADLLCLSGGVPADLPLAQQARARGLRLVNDSQLFLEACSAPTIGITGSAGKTTTTELVGRMATAQFRGQNRRAWVGGNIGNPLLTDLEHIRPDDLVVLELSSFQLEIMTLGPHVAAVLNITPNHLDRHRTMETYTSAKARILDYQRAGGVAVLGYEDPGAWSLRSRARGRLIAFGRQVPAGMDAAYVEDGHIAVRLEGQERRVAPLSAIELRGPHNVANVLAACAVAAGAGLDPEAMAEGLRGFRGVAHRLEFVRQVRGARWFNDSIATAPERAIAAIRSFEEPLVLLAGGRDKDLPWGSFADLVCQRVDHLVLFGEAAAKIAAAVEKARRGAQRPYTVDICRGMEEAVSAAARRAESGDVVLLAPGGTSFDQFADFAARGERFKELVNGL